MSRFHKPTPHRKKATATANNNSGLPFPNFALGKTEIPAVCRCIYDGNNFFVTNHLDMHTLHYNVSCKDDLVKQLDGTIMLLAFTDVSVSLLLARSSGLY